MESLTIKEIISITKGIVIKNNNNDLIEKIVIDNREVVDQSLFIPIIGEVHDGHKFMESAYDAGCRNFLIDEKHEFLKNNINLIRVKDTTIALGDIARYYREKFNIPFIGITGSVGKTSTKDIITSVVKTFYNTLSTEGNLNNEIGIPKTLFNLNDNHEVGVLELGLSYKGDISYYSSIIEPTIAVISNIGMSHIEHFENQEGIFNAKLEIVEKFTKDNILIVNGDDSYLSTLKNQNLNYKLLTYGFEKDNTIYCTDYTIKNNKTEFTCIINNNEERFIIPSTAKHNIYNSMAGILVGLSLNIKMNLVKEGLANFELTKGRLTIIEKDDFTIIDDSYNASSDSTISALNVLSSYKNRRIAILGDVLETGKYEEYIHRKIGQNIKNNADILITVGESSKYIKDEAIKNGFEEKNILSFSNVDEVISMINSFIKKDDVLLIKASHGINLTKLVNYLD